MPPLKEQFAGRPAHGENSHQRAVIRPKVDIHRAGHTTTAIGFRLRVSLGREAGHPANLVHPVSKQREHLRFLVRPLSTSSVANAGPKFISKRLVKFHILKRRNGRVLASGYARVPDEVPWCCYPPRHTSTPHQ